MDRRRFLSSISAAGTVLVAGCGSSGGDDPGDTETNTISSGTRIRAPPVGVHASGVALGDREPDTLAASVADELDVDRADVRVGTETNTIEVFSNEVGVSDFASAVRATGLDIDGDDVTTGVTDQTRDTVVEVLRDRLDQREPSSGTVSTTDDGLVVAEIPDTAPEQAREIVTSRGTVRIIAEVRAPETEMATNTTVLRNEHIANTSEIEQRPNGGGWSAPVTLTESGAQRFQSQVDELGFTGENGPGNCDRTRGPGPGSYCLLTTLDGEAVSENSLAPDFVNALQDGTWEQRRTFTIGASNVSEAAETKRNLELGSIPTTLDLDAPAAEVTRIGE